MHQFDFQSIRNARILLVDDVETSRMVAQALLSQAGLSAEIAVNGLEALAMVNQNNYDLVLMDIQMPVMDGLDATRAIRSNCAHAKLPILAMSANATSADHQRSLQVGMNGHLTKPIDPNALFTALLRWIQPRKGMAGTPVAPVVPKPAEADPTPIPPLDGIDTERGLINHLRRPALYRQILIQFQREFGGAANAIAHALAQRDFVLARRLAHSVKSVAATIGAQELSECARQLEDRYEQHQRADALLPPFEAALRRVLASLSALPAPETAATTPTNITVEVKIAMIDQLERLLRQDDAATGRLLDQLEASLPDPKVQQCLRVLRNLIDDVEYPEALKVMPQLRHSVESPTP